MITKLDYARYIVTTFKVRYEESNNTTLEDEDLHKHIYESTSLGIALEFLGLLKDPNEIEYLRNRGGTRIVCSLEEPPYAHVLTTREIFDLLPDTL